MKTINLKTGYGYFTDAEGRVVAKYELPKGEHQIKDGYAVHEVTSKGALAGVVVCEPPRSSAMVRAEKISAEIEKMAVERLIAKGEISE